MTNLKSFCVSATIAPYTMPVTASAATGICHALAPSGNNVIATRNAPYAPSFMTTPARSMDAAVGAATWPVGAQVWNGQRPARIAKPTNTNGKAQYWKSSGNGYFASSNRLIVYAPAITYAAMMPMSTIALPTNE